MTRENLTGESLLMKSVTSSDVKKQEKKKHDMMTIASITKKIKDLKEKISLGENMKTPGEIYGFGGFVRG